MKQPRQTIDDHITEALADLARARGYSVARLARDAKVGHGTAQRLLSGEPILLASAQRIADLFGLQVAQFQLLVRK